MANPNPKLSNLVPFRPGQSGNPGGRAVGARNRITAGFLGDLADVWEEGGKAALERACKKTPMAFAKMVASLMPKQFEDAMPLDGAGNKDIEMMLTLVRAVRASRDESNGQS
jgi:hypothetical protein